MKNTQQKKFAFCLMIIFIAFAFSANAATNITGVQNITASGVLWIGQDALLAVNSGNVGIGTTSPQNTLHVIGSASVAGSVNASYLNVTGFSITDDSLVRLSDGSEKKIKDIKAGEEVLTLDEKTGKLVARKVNALLDHGIKPIYEMATEDGRAINTTAEHPYLVKLYSKEECYKFAGNVWNKEADEFNNYCTRWIQVQHLKEGDEIAAPRINNYYSPKNISTNSGVAYTLISSCFLKSSSLDQIAQPRCSAKIKVYAT